MPELPEVETTRLGLYPSLVKTPDFPDLSIHIKSVLIREHRLRWPIDKNLGPQLSGQKICDIQRRSKYLLFMLEKGVLLVHLGMTGRLCLCQKDVPPLKHSHIDIHLSSKQILRYTDARRFGCIIYLSSEQYPDYHLHPLLSNLGLEPLSTEFNYEALQRITSSRKMPIKSLLMDAKLIVGIGNIYAQEALFYAKINPERPANSLKGQEIKDLYKSIQKVLNAALEAGGTSFRDFVDANGEKGYFQQSLAVYQRGAQPCIVCQHPLESIRQQGRTTTYCLHCQK